MPPESAELRKAQQEDAELAPYIARIGEGSEKAGGKEEFVLRGGVLYRSWVEDDGGELAQVVVPVNFVRPQFCWFMRVPWRDICVLGKPWLGYGGISGGRVWLFVSPPS